MATIIPMPGETLEDAIKRFTKACRVEDVFKDMKRAADVKRLQDKRLPYKAPAKRSEAIKRAEQRHKQIIRQRNEQICVTQAAPAQATNKE